MTVLSLHIQFSLESHWHRRSNYWRCLKRNVIWRWHFYIIFLLERYQQLLYYWFFLSVSWTGFLILFRIRDSLMTNIRSIIKSRFWITHLTYFLLISTYRFQNVAANQPLFSPSCHNTARNLHWLYRIPRSGLFCFSSTCCPSIYLKRCQ